MAMILSFVVSALLLAVCGSRTPRKQINGADARKDVFSVSASSLSLSIGGGSPAAPASSAFPPQAAPTLGLTMADFTGDTHPDLARVELDRVDSTNAHYWIEIRLTEGGGQILKLTAPFGGLFVTPKDVTGDGNLDLIVYAAKTRALVAVFLNDGNGHFDRARTERFAKSLSGAPSSFSLTRKLMYVDAILGCPESHVIECPSRSLRPLLETDDSYLPTDHGAVSYRFFALSSNRAPPSLA